MTHLFTNKFVYAGPSWATLSYGPQNYDVNLASLWGWDCHRINFRGSGNKDMLDELKTIAHIPLPVVYIFCEPLVDIFKGYIPGKRDWNINKTDEYLMCDNHREFRKQLMLEQLHNLNDIGLRIGFIGSHSDITENDISQFKNLSIIYPSWQQWMKEQVGIDKSSLNFGAEIATNMITYFTEITPNKLLVDDIHDQLDVWRELEQNNMFSENHPNSRSNFEFAEFTRPMVEKFLETNT